MMVFGGGAFGRCLGHGDGALLNGISALIKGFPGGSDGNESTCNAGDLGWILRSGRSLDEGKATHHSILA